MTSTTGTVVKFNAADGERLSGHFFEASQCKGAVLLAGATGVKQQFYFKFCQWLNSCGYSVLTFDYRGIGESLNQPIKECKARKQDWGELDMPAALDWISLKVAGAPVHLIGHSAGGQLAGLLPNYAKLSSIVQVASSTGFVGKISMPDRILAFTLLAIYGPICAKIFGYVPVKLLGWGEDLPSGIARQWSQWCLSPGYVANGFGKEIKEHHFNEISQPILAISATDDAIATQPNVDAVLSLYPHAKIKQLRLNPSDYGLKQIGHVDFFRSKSHSLWPLVSEWFAEVEKS